MRKILLLLVLVFGLIQVSEAQSGYALSLPGGSVTTSKMAIPPLNTLITSYPFTVEMWVKPKVITQAGGFWVDRSGSDVSLQFTNDANGGLRNDIFGTNTNSGVLSAVKPTINVWHHIALIARADSVIVEYDGTFYAALNTISFLTSFCSKYSHIGVDSTGATSTRTVNGMFDEIRIWNTARTRDEIRSNKSTVLAGTETGLVAYYNFDGNNSNDKTVNALNGVVTGGTLIDLNAVSKLSNITTSHGKLIPAFHPDSSTYTLHAPEGVVVTGIPVTSGYGTISNNPYTLTASSSSVTMVSTSGDGLSTTSYTINLVPLTVGDWDANGTTGTYSYPYFWGWDNTTSAIPWNTANGGGGCRYRDYNVAGGYTGFTHVDSGANAVISRQFMLRFDGAAYSTSYYSFPVVLGACKTYDFDWDYVCGGSATPPKNITVGIDTTKTGLSRLSSKTFATTSSTTIYKHGRYTFSTGARAGIYYLTINGDWAWFGINNLALAESTTPVVSVTPETISLTNVNKSANIVVKGSVLTSDVTVVAPAGITLNRTTIPSTEFACGNGVTITATYDYTQNISSGIIRFTSGAAADTVAFTYTRPTVSIYEKNIEVENNGRPYPLNIKAVSNSVDSLYVSTTNGFSVVKNNYSVTDFTNGSGSINVQVNSSATVGTTGKIYFYYKPSGVITKIDSVNVTKVAAYTRYFIQHKQSGLVIGNHSSGLYPALTAKTGTKQQKFFFRRINILPTTKDTFYIVQDSAYRAMREDAATTWNTEFGVPVDKAKWKRDTLSVGTDSISFTNIVRNGLLGSDNNTADARLYDNKAYGSSTGYRTVWYLIDASSSDSTLSSITLNTGTLRPVFCRDTIIYDAILPLGTTSVTPTVVPTIAGASVTGDGAVDVSSGSGVSTILVTAADGKSKMTYTINYAVAKSDDATLTSLTLNIGTLNPSFSSGTTSYTVILPVGTTSVTATAVPNVPGAVVTGDGTVDVSSGRDTSRITVTALDGTTQLTYTVAYSVAKSTDATLSNLTVNGTQVAGFATNTLIYNVKLPANASVPTVVGTATDAKASVIVTAATALPGSTFIDVTAEDGTTSLRYTISFTLKSTDATLSDLRVNGTTVTGFATSTLTYNVKVSANATVPTVVGTATDAVNASVTVTPATALPGSTTVEVTAENGNKMTYTVSFTLKSTDATLSDLRVNGTQVSGFAAATTTYSVVLPIGTTTVPEVTATATALATAVVTPATGLPGATTVKVTAEDTTSKTTYTINFTVTKSTDNTLSNLTVDGVAVSGFANNVYSYNVNLPAGTTIVPTVVGTPTYSGASVAVVPANALPGSTYVVVTPESGSPRTYTINFTVGTGIPQFAGTAKVYPTVTSSNFTVETDGSAGTITVVDMVGKVVSIQDVTSSVQVVNISGAGMYQIVVESNKKITKVKVVKTN